MHFDRQPRRTKPIQLTSLIDVMFFCLFFFMLSTSFVKIQSLELGLPQADGKKGAKAADRTIMIDIGSTGELYWNHSPIPLESFGMQVKDLLNRDPQKSFLVRAGEHVSVQKLVDTLDMIYSLGGRYVAVDRFDESAEGAVSSGIPLTGVDVIEVPADQVPKR